MRQITIEVPLDTLPQGLIPEKLLNITSSIKFLRLDFKEGFLFACRVHENKCEDVIRFLRKHYGQVRKGIVKVSHEGEGLILVSGAWMQDRKYLRDGNGNKGYLSEEKEWKLMAICKSRIYFLRWPEIIGNSIRFVLVGDSESLRMLEKTLDGVGLPYSVRKISGFEKSTDSVFDRLTPQQMRILRLAYVEGYYSVPRKINTEQLAKLLKMEKGNVGEHLRRAEKNVMDFLMTA